MPAKVPAVEAADHFSVSPLAQVQLDAAWTVVRANQAWISMVGSGLGARWIDLIQPDDLAAQLSSIGGFPESGKLVARLQARLRTEHADWLPCDLILSATDAEHLFVMALPTPAPPLAAPAIHDDRRLLASALSHDVRQHARLVTAYCSLLARGALEERQRSLLGVASDHADRLQHLLTALVRWLRLADEEPSAGSCDLAVAWAEATSGLEADIVPSELPVIRADRALVTELLRELALNAVRYHPARVKIQCQAHWQQGHWLIEVADDGAGIPCADRERVLSPLHRLHSWEQVPGHGMGLAIAARIAGRHGGTLTITDAQLGGCMVQVLIPG